MSSESYVIRSTHPDLVLDATEREVKIQTFNGAPSQLWTFELADQGRQFIVNKENGKVLDIERGVIPNANLITFPKHGRANQQWYVNSDKTIVSSKDNLAVDIFYARFVPGTQIIAHPTHGRNNQLFTFEKQ